jgi:CRP/FNR family transcriptional regulator, cyclic AMP receptor protein
VRGGSQRVSVLEAEPSLGDGLDQRSVSTATRSAIASTSSLPRGRWQSEPWTFDVRGSLGLLLVEGMIARQLLVGEMEAVELLGPGDVLRPWAEVDRETSHSLRESWIVPRQARLALLDRAFAVSIGPWPEISANIADRIASRIGWMALFSAIQGMRRVDERLLAILWSYADRWGRVTPRGVMLQLDLTHRLLAGVIGARRPSVTTALKALEADGTLTRRKDRTWLLHGKRPAILATLDAGRRGQLHAAEDTRSDDRSALGNPSSTTALRRAATPPRQAAGQARPSRGSRRPHAAPRR